MKLIGVKFQGLTCFEQPAGFSTDAPGLIALVGRNGAGKTTALEAVFGALYRQMPSYPGPLYDQVRGETASIVATFMDDAGDVIRAEVKLNAKRRTSECYLTRRGEPLSTGKGRDYDEQVRRLFGSPELVLASVFASQSKSGAFLTMPRAQRKALFAELLALGRLVALHEGAGARVRALEGSLAAARSRLATLGEGEPLADVESALVDATSEVAQAEARVAELKFAADAWEAWRIENDAGVVAHRQAVADHERVLAELATAAGRVDALRARVERMEQEWQRRPEPGMPVDDPAVLVFAVEEATSALTRAEEQAGELAGAERALNTARRERSQVQAELDTAERMLRAEREALVRQAAPLDRAPCTTYPAWEGPPGNPEGIVELAGTCPLLANARDAAAEVLAVDERIAEIPLARERRLAECASEASVDELAARVEELVALDLPTTTVRLRRELEQARAKLRTYEAALREVESYADEKARFERAIGEVRDDLTAAIDEHERLLDSEAVACDRVGEAREALDNIGPGPGSAARELREEAEVALRRAIAKRSAAEAKVEAARSRETRAIVVRHELGGLETAAADLSLLREALGPNGVQALMIDAAGPEVTAIVNDLLSETPFTIRLDTVRTKADGGQAEDFAVHVFDGGEERGADQFSGGQKVFLGEALGLGLAVFNSRRSGVHWRTLFRDETAGALDPENAQHYVRMLRRALVAGGFANCLFVSHVPEVWEQADTVLHVGGGRIE